MQEQEFDNRVMVYVGAKLTKIGNFMISLSKFGGFITAIVCLFNYSRVKKLLRFREFGRKALNSEWDTETFYLKYYDMGDVKPRVAELLNYNLFDTVLAGTTLLCGAIGAAVVALGDRMRCRHRDNDKH